MYTLICCLQKGVRFMSVQCVDKRSLSLNFSGSCGELSCWIIGFAWLGYLRVIVVRTLFKRLLTYDQWGSTEWQETWWRHQMNTFSALLALWVGKSPVNSPHKGQWRGSLIFFFDLRLSKQSWGWWSETPSRPLCRNCNEGSSNCTKILVMLLFGSSPSQPWRKFLDHCGLNADLYQNAQPNPYTERNITKCYETERKLWI